ncbi:ribonuclease HII [Cognatiyoonia koreensis]|nr:ribonuclease HII [Cognatiyoonia koreensis]
MKQPEPDFEFETNAYKHGFLAVCGVDEVGRGPLAGPVTAAAVILDPANIPEGLNDSKKLSVKKREALFDLLMIQAHVAIGEASVAEIDEHNILRASHMAMVRAIAGLKTRADYALIDGNQTPRGLTIRSETLVKGDSRSLSIAAASIVAKVWRDRLMVTLSQQYPHYGWETNAGYGTKVHQEGLKSHGVTPHHRRSFAPIHNMLWQEKNLSR